MCFHENVHLTNYHSPWILKILCYFGLRLRAICSSGFEWELRIHYKLIMERTTYFQHHWKMCRRLGVEDSHLIHAMHCERIMDALNGLRLLLEMMMKME